MSTRFYSLLVSLSLLLGGFRASAVFAQQVLVDDASSVSHGAAQLEVWHSRPESWIVPAVRVLPVLEIALGTAFLRTNRRHRRTVVYSAEGKVLVHPEAPHGLGLAAVGGTRLQHLRMPPGHPLSVYGYGILTEELMPGRLKVYQNLGWLKTNTSPHRLTWGVRLDWTPHDRLTLIGETYGQGRAAPSLQTSLRSTLLPDRVEMDVSLTWADPLNHRHAWATIGLTFMSAPLF